MIEFTIPGQPVGKSVKVGYGRFYNTEETADYYERVRDIFKTKYPHHKPLDCPLIVHYEAFYTIPNSWSKKKQESARNGEIRPIVKPDGNNISKIFDALNKIAWRDDAIIVDDRTSKWYSIRPRVEVIIKEWKFE